jgi:hypothetical protein
LPALSNGDITSDRRETKYLIPMDRVGGLANALRQHLPLHRFTGENANALPGAHHYITTVYFDTPSRRHYRAATSGARSVKLRAREYYDVHPSLAEVATHADEILKYDPWLWFELKRRGAGRSEKRRFRLPKRDVPALFARASSTERSTPPNGELEVIEAYLRELDEPLEATCLVNYRRVAWQSPDDALRVTLDLGLACYAPPADLFTRERPLERGLLGKPASVLDDAVLEVKACRGEPAWLADAIRGAAVVPLEFSKFVAAAQSVHAHG